MPATGGYCENTHETEGDAKSDLHFALAAWKPSKMIGLNRVNAPTVPNCRKGPVACEKRWQKLMDKHQHRTNSEFLSDNLPAATEEQSVILLAT